MQDLVFWLVAGLMGFGAGAVLLRALRPQSDRESSPEIGVYRDQLAEVDRDLAREVISPDEAARMRTEVSRRLLDAARAAPKPVVSGGTLGLPMAAIFAAIAGALGLYLWLGWPDYADMPLQKRLAQAQQFYDNRPTQAEAERDAAPKGPADKLPADPEFAALITQLRAAVADRPNDAQGLQLLARNEAILGNYAASAAAYQRLITAKGETANLEDHLGAAQAMIAATDGMVSPEAEAQLKAALLIDPQNGMARYFSGLMFAQVGRPDRAFALWEPLLREGPIDAPYIEPIRAMLQGLADAAGIRYQLPDAKGPTASDMANAAQMSDADRQDMIKTMVAGLESRLMDQGGTLQEWQKLIKALGVLNDPARQTAAIAAARRAFADDPAAVQTLSATP